MSATASLRHTLRGHRLNVSRLTVSPPENVLVSGSQDGSIRIWNWISGRELHHYETHSRVQSVAGSPSGPYLAAGNQSGQIMLWQTSALALEPHVLKAHEGSILDLTWSRQGHLLASGGSDNRTKLWHIAEHTMLLSILPTPSYINTLAWSPDGKRFAIGVGQGRVRICDPFDTQPTVFLGNDCNTNAISWTQDQQLLICGLWNAPSLNLFCLRENRLIEQLDFHSGSIQAVAISPRYPNLVASRCTHGKLCFWTIEGRHLLNRITGLDSSYPYAGLVFHPNAPLLAVAKGKDIQVWEFHPERIFQQSLEAIPESVPTKKQKDKFTLFFAYNRQDNRIVRRIKTSLESMGVNVWMDESDIKPTENIVRSIEAAIASVDAAAIFFGRSGAGRFQETEIKALIMERHERGAKTIAVLLPGVSEIPIDQRFLRLENPVRFSTKTARSSEIQTVAKAIRNCLQ